MHAAALQELQELMANVQPQLLPSLGAPIVPARSAVAHEWHALLERLQAVLSAFEGSKGQQALGTGAEVSGLRGALQDLQSSIAQEAWRDQWRVHLCKLSASSIRSRAALTACSEERDQLQVRWAMFDVLAACQGRTRAFVFECTLTAGYPGRFGQRHYR